MPGYFCRMAPTSPGMILIASLCSVPTLIFPILSPSSEEDSSLIRSTRPTISRTWSRICCPSSVRTTPRRSRLKRVIPISFSKEAKAGDTADCVMPSLSPASLILPRDGLLHAPDFSHDPGPDPLRPFCSWHEKGLCSGRRSEGPGGFWGGLATDSGLDVTGCLHFIRELFFKK